MNFENIINQLNNHHSPISVKIPSDWSQGRTTFGGVTSALLHSAMRTEIDSARLLRSMNINFVAPVLVDVPITIEVEVLREGRSVSQVVAKAIQNNQTCILAQASFGKNRESRIHVEAEKNPFSIAPKDGYIITQKEDMTPSFLQHFDLSVCQGEAPFSDSSNHNLAGWMRFSNAEMAPSDSHIIALIDVWPATILQMFNEFTPASSLSWSLEFIHSQKQTQLKPDSWLSYEAITRYAGNGYAHTEANIRNEKGDLIAISRQVVVAYQ
jgi:acyl-CoA thioesterase II